MYSAVIAIPAYKPDTALVSLVHDLRRIGFPQIILVDDGSGPSYSNIFGALTELEGVSVLVSEANSGKGDALKKAFRYYLANYSENYKGIITVDADGQHLPEDIKRVAEEFSSFPSDLVLGVREFKGYVPLRSRIGNSLTKYIFAILTGALVKDTQTGLRAIPNRLIPDIATFKSNGYEFELEMLLHAIKHHFEVKQVAINTVYELNNASSHFNPILDSLIIYSDFIRFCLASMGCAAIDYLVFAILFFTTKNLAVSSLSARVLSGVINFYAGKSLVFNSDQKVLPEIGKYVSLWGALIFLSIALSTFLWETLGLSPYLAKIFADVFLFFISFSFQNLMVFRKTLTGWEVSNQNGL